MLWGNIHFLVGQLFAWKNYKHLYKQFFQVALVDFQLLLPLQASLQPTPGPIFPDFMSVTYVSHWPHFNNYRWETKDNPWSACVWL